MQGTCKRHTEKTLGCPCWESNPCEVTLCHHVTLKPFPIHLIFSICAEYWGYIMHHITVKKFIIMQSTFPKQGLNGSQK